eukprot:5335715-Karenia_brevis.AAC.1
MELEGASRNWKICNIGSEAAASIAGGASSSAAGAGAGRMASQTDLQSEVREAEGPVLCEPCMPGLDIGIALEGDQIDELSEEDAAENLWDVQSLPSRERPFATEQDAAETACRSLARRLRSRPTLPPDPSNFDASW